MPRMETKKRDKMVWKPRAARVTPGMTMRRVWRDENYNRSEAITA
jgi:hypothetical protein